MNGTNRLTLNEIKRVMLALPIMKKMKVRPQTTTTIYVFIGDVYSKIGSCA